MLIVIFFRLGKAGSNDNRPLKLLLGSKEDAANILSTFADAKRSGTSFPPGFRIVKDKTALKRTLLRYCHSELDQRTQAGEVGLRIVYVDGIPKVSLNQPRSRNFPQRSSTVNR